LIEESDVRPDLDLDDERRRYYRLTDDGGRLAAAEIQRMSKMVTLAQAKRLVSRFASAA